MTIETDRICARAEKPGAANPPTDEELRLFHCRRGGKPEDTFMDTRIVKPELNLIFDAESNAFDAAVSEGWPLPRHRTAKAKLGPRDEPCSAFLIPKAARTERERIAAPRSRSSEP